MIGSANHYILYIFGNLGKNSVGYFLFSGIDFLSTRSIPAGSENISENVQWYFSSQRRDRRKKEWKVRREQLCNQRKSILLWSVWVIQSIPIFNFFFLKAGFLDIKVGTGKKLMSHRKQNYMSSCHDLHCVLLINPSTAYYWNCSISLILGKRISVENSKNHNTVNCLYLFFSLYKGTKSICHWSNNSGKNMKLFVSKILEFFWFVVSFINFL